MSDTDNDHLAANAGGGEASLDDIHEDGEVTTAREAVDRASAALEAMPANPTVPPGADPTAALMAQMLHTMQMQNAQSQLQYAQARLDDKLQQQKFQLQLEELRRQKDAPASGRLKPSVFDLEKGKDSFATWRERWRYHVQESGFDKIRDPKVRAVKMRASLQQALSDFTLKWIHNQGFSAENLESTEFLIMELERYIKNSTNPLVMVTELFARKQEAGESIESFVTWIREHAKLCEFEDITDVSNWFTMLCLCCNVTDTDTRHRLVKEKGLTFERAVEICLEEEKTLKTSKQLARGSAPGEACATSSYQKDRKNQQQAKQQGQNDRSRSQSRGRKANGRDRSQSKAGSGKCFGCGQAGHRAKAPECRAADKVCHNCNKKGHFAKMCHAPKRPDSEGEGNTIFLGSLTVSSTDITPLENIEVTLTGPNGMSKQVRALPDTGANISCITPELYKEMGLKLKDLEKEDLPARTADKTPLGVLGKAKFRVTLGKFQTETIARVVKNLSRPILSLRCCKDLHLVPENFPHGHVEVNVTQVDNVTSVKTGYPELDNLISRYPQVFDGRCKVMKGGQHHIELDENAKPISSGATRAIAEPYMPALEKELADLVRQDIIEPVQGATEWLHPIVVVPKKDGAIRMCVDLTKLNKYIIRPTNPQPTPWEVVRMVPKGKKHFAVFDALKGYHQIELDEESRALTTFLTPFGRYRYRRLPMGESDAQDVFTLRYGSAVDAATEGRRSTEDTLLLGDTLQELLGNTEEFFKACDANGITLNTKKIQWDCPEVLFAGFVVNGEGYKIDPVLTKALSEFPVPKNLTDLKSFMGLANQTCNFSAEIAKCMCPLKPLLKKGIRFDWLPEHQAAFEAARSLLSSTKMLAFYNATRQTRLICDASRLFGLGFVLKQEVEPNVWKTVQAGSRFLSPAETRYAMIELEMLAIAWAAKKCAMFIEGMPSSQLEIWTDHQPLVPILERYSLPEIENKRLQRLKMKIMHLQYRIKWVKGTDNVEADSLSRAPHAKAKSSDLLDEDVEDDESHVAEVQVVQVFETVDTKLRDERLLELKKFANQDVEYQQLSRYLSHGHPDSKQEWPDNLKQFFPMRDDLFFDTDGFIIYGDKLFVPTELRTTYLKRLLAMHQGAHKMSERAKKSIWWPFINRDIKNVAKTCESCVERAPSNRQEAEMQHEQAIYPFQFLHIDLAQYGGRYFLITVDQYSGFPSIYECGKTASTKQVTDHLKQLFATFSIPVTIYSDGGPQFLEGDKVDKFEFGKFCKDWGVQHVTSSPHHPQSNGIAEEAVKEMKKIISATFDADRSRLKQSELAAALLLFRNTPRAPTDLSPSEMVFGQIVRDNLPISRQLFKPQARYEVEKRLREVREERDRRNRVVKPFQHPLLHPGQTVRIQDPATKRWRKTGTIIDFGVNEREYRVKADNGRIYRRNRKFLKPEFVKAEPPPAQPVRAPELSGERSLPPPGVEERAASPSLPSRAPTGTTPTTSRPGNLVTSRPKRAIRKPLRFREEENQVFNI